MERGCLCGLSLHAQYRKIHLGCQPCFQPCRKEREQGRFWAEYMKQAGYKTYFTGKWHVKANAEKAFDVARHIRGGMPNQTPAGYNRPLPDQPDPWSPYDPQFEGFWKEASTGVK